MPSAFILGPSKWREEPKSAITVAPLDMRRHLAQISSSLGIPGIVMEDEEHRGEDFTTKFNRLVQERDVQVFVFYVPASARRSGMDVEVGAVLQWMELGWLHPKQVYVLAERVHYQEDDGFGSLNEEGNRTWYYHDLASKGCRIRLFLDRDSLTAHMAFIAAEAKAWHAAWHEALAPGH